MKDFCRRRIFLFLPVLILAFDASATVVTIDSLDTMAKKSEVILHARVVDQRVEEDVEGRIVTLTTLKTIEGYKGTDGADTITLYQVGGELGGRVLRVSGAQRYGVGEEIVLFGLTLDRMMVSYGVGLGKFKVIRNKRGARVIEDLNDLVEAKPGKDAGLLLRAPIARQYASFAQFRSTILEAIKPAGKELRRKPIKKKQSLSGSGVAL